MSLFRRAKPPPGPPGKPPKRRRFRTWVRCCFGLLLLIPVLVVVCTQGPVATWIISKGLGAATGAKMHAKWTSLKLDGRLVISQPRFIAPQVQGPAGIFAEAERLELDLDWSKLWSLNLRPVAARIDKPVVRVSQDKVTGRLNIATLAVPAGSTQGPMQLPRLDLVAGRFEFGENDDFEYKVLQDLPVRGSISPADSKDQAYRVQLRLDESAAWPNPDNIPVDGAVPLLDGEFDFKTSSGRISITRLLLARIDPDRVPVQFRSTWRDLRMRGEIADATVRYDPVRGVEAEFKLSDIALNVPVASGRPETTGGRMPRMENVTGVIKFSDRGLEAALDGLFEDLPCRVTLRTEGPTTDAAYQAVIQSSAFRLERDPRILWFAPEIVREDFERFGGPTALVDARIEIKRAAPTADGPGATSIRGTLHLKEGRAEFEKFPYPIGDLAGTITFDDTEMRIVEMVGRSPRGARLYTEGRWSMAEGDSSCELQVTVTDIPIDDLLEEAINRSGARELVRAIFSRRQYQKLLDTGLVITPQQHEQLSAELAAAVAAGRPERELDILRSRLAAPQFSFGGVIDKLRVDLRHAKSPAAQFVTNIDIDFKPVGIVPDAFPYPIIADDLKMKIDDEKAVLSGMSFRGLRGGVSEVTASVKLGGKGDPSPPEITVSAKGVPVDSLMLNATPDGRVGDAPSVPSDPGTLSIKRLIDSLNVDGAVDVVARVGPPKHPGDEGLDYAVEITMDGLNAAPLHTGDGQAIRIENLKGSLSLVNGDINVTGLEGFLGAAEPLVPGEPDRPAPFHITGTTSVAGAMDMHLTLKRLDVGLAVEDLIGLVSPPGRELIEHFRAERHPQGHADIVALATAKAGKPIEAELALTGAEGLEIDMLRDRVGIDMSEGRIVLRTGAEAPSVVSLEGARLFLWWQGLPSGDVSLEGEFVLPSDGGKLAVRREVVATTRGAAFASGLVRRLMDLAAPPSIAELVHELKPTGRFDADVRITPRSPDAPTDWAISGSIRPLSFGFENQGVEYSLQGISGTITLSAAGGTINHLVLTEPDWSLAVDGRWSAPGGNEPWSVSLTTSATAERLSHSLMALLPESALTAIADVKLEISRGLWFENAVATASGVGDKLTGLSVTADVNFADLQAELGLVVTHADGVLRLRATRGPEDDRTRLRLKLEAQRAMLSGLNTENLVAAFVSGDNPGEWSIPSVTADSYGGRVSGSGSVQRGRTDDAADLYALKVQASGVRFGDILAQTEERDILDAGPPSPESIQRIDELRRQRQPAVVIDPSGNTTRGRVDAELAIAGAVGSDASRRGRGSVRIAGGDIVRLPLVVNLLELSNLAFPAGSSLDFAEADFYLDANRITFDMLGVSSQTILVNGKGTVTLPNFNLDLSFTSASRLRVPLISDLIEGIRNELVTVTVKGTLQNPKYGTEPFTGTRDALREIFGSARK